MSTLRATSVYTHNIQAKLHSFTKGIAAAMTPTSQLPMTTQVFYNPRTVYVP